MSMPTPKKPDPFSRPLTMIHIFPVQKINIDPVARRERLVVCTADRDGNLHIMGLEKYLRRGRRHIGQGRREVLTAENPANVQTGTPREA